MNHADLGMCRLSPLFREGILGLKCGRCLDQELPEQTMKQSKRHPSKCAAQAVEPLAAGKPVPEFAGEL